MDRKLKAIENIIFIGAVSLSLYALGITFFKNNSLPPGVCPIDNNRWLIYISIGLLMVSFIFSHIVNKFIQTKNKS